MDKLDESSREIYEYFANTAINITKVFERDEQKNEIEILKELVTQQSKLNEKLKAIQQISDFYSNYHILDLTEEVGLELLAEYKDKVAQINPDVSESQNLLDFNEQVDDILKAFNDNPEDCPIEDEELQLTESIVNIVDPITKKRIVHPVKNTACGHVYDKESVTAMLKINKKTRCPVAGCKNKQYIDPKNLKVDIATKLYLHEHPEVPLQESPNNSFL
ncbi:E3 SUMO-protein ligase NSE2 [Orussus abietinus]|uniref:E3 SUMO-protein ligase NSE2 n=1 Tax=Orussus abietinus TaxID=222816 RepID=UPI000625A8EF|nr:E3 SUMO-protein ligase NSE2 [Orussus abietinus]